MRSRNLVSSVFLTVLMLGYFGPSAEAQQEVIVGPVQIRFTSAVADTDRGEAKPPAAAPGRKSIYCSSWTWGFRCRLQTVRPNTFSSPPSWGRQVRVKVPGQGTRRVRFSEIGTSGSLSKPPSPTGTLRVSRSWCGGFSSQTTDEAASWRAPCESQGKPKAVSSRSHCRYPTGGMPYQPRP